MIVSATPRPKPQAPTPSDFVITVILDTGSPNVYLPSSLAETITSRNGAVILHQGTPYVSCALRQSVESLELGFGDKTR